MTPSRRVPIPAPPDDPYAVTRRRLARLLAIGAVRAATSRPEAVAPTTEQLEPANNPGGGDALAG